MIRNNLKWIGGIALAGSLAFTGCTKKFEDLNTNKTKLTTVGKGEFPYLFSKAQSEASQNFWEYQVSQNLFADLFAQYFATTAPYFPSDRYTMRHDWLNFFWSSIYVQAAPQLKAILENAEKNSPEYALASIWWVGSFHRV
ncbi:MAG TPA: SusD/RagB family nutrient-binding outer membrane lipoprotein, partial [Phnomibacter sp.]|nr:SusD/RagB family nutrient-binding outer membrane lipoprotein [Phnomibacter sp.]